MAAARGPAVGLMSRAPEPGLTKSRLAAGIGDEAAARLAEAFLLDAAETVRAAEGWHPVLLVEPADAVGALAARTGIADVRPQGRGHIGLRMLAAMRSLAAGGYAPLILVGSDIPLLAPRHLRHALRVLRRADVVYGPAEDGGYYLVGMWKPRPALFDDPSLRWGGAGVLAASERLARAAGLSSGRLPPEHDVDTLEDLEWLGARLTELEGRGEAVPPRIAAALRELARTRRIRA